MSEWNGLWQRWDKGEVDPFALITCFPDFIKRIRAEGDALKERCQYHKKQSEERGKRASTLRKSRDAFIESLARAEEKLEAVKPILKQIEENTNSRPPRVSLEELHLNEQWCRIWDILDGGE